jgi:hypothetical protein
MEIRVLQRVNGSQSKFFDLTWVVSQNWPDAPLFQLDLNYVAIGKLLVLKTGLGTWKSQRKTKLDAWKDTSETPTTKIRWIVSHTFRPTSYGCVWENTTRAQRELEKLESFDPATRERYRFPHARIRKIGNNKTTAKNLRWPENWLWTKLAGWQRTELRAEV